MSSSICPYKNARRTGRWSLQHSGRTRVMTVPLRISVRRSGGCRNRLVYHSLDPSAPAFRLFRARRRRYRTDGSHWLGAREAAQIEVDRIDPRLFLLELLPGWYDDWVIFERERLAQLQLHFLEALAYALVDRRCLAQALDVALRLVSADPLQEASQHALLCVYRSERSLGQARRQYAAYRELIRRTFGCEPHSCSRRVGGRRPRAAPR